MTITNNSVFNISTAHLTKKLGNDSCYKSDCNFTFAPMD